MEQITLREIREEVAAMLTTCFEGALTKKSDELIFTFPNGQQFSVLVNRYSACDGADSFTPAEKCRLP